MSRSGSRGERDDDHEGEAGESEHARTRGPGSGPSRAKEQADGVQTPQMTIARRHRASNVAPIEAGTPTAIPSVRTGREMSDRPRREPVERLERRQAERRTVTVASLQPSVLPEVETRERRGEREAGERGEHEADVQRREEVRVVAGRPAPVPPPARARGAAPRQAA